MRRSLIATAALAALVLCAFTLPGLAQDAVMKLNNTKAYAGGKQRGPVTFTHDKHIGSGYECTACHHKYDPKQPGKNLWTEGDETSCQACHGGAKPTAKTALRESYHKLCVDCHEKTPPAKHDFGPRACAGCHAVN